MGEEEFYCILKEKISEKMEKQGVDFCFEYITKNNNQKLPVLMIRGEREGVSPVIHLKNLYEQVQNGQTLEAVIEEVMYVWEKAMEQKVEIPESFFEFEEAKERLFFRLVNLGMNVQLWEDTPFLPWNDLALTVRYLVTESEEGISSILVTEKEITRWGVTLEEVFAEAKIHTKRLFPAKIMEFSSMFPTLLQEKESNQMYILTNTKEVNGATTLCYPNIVWEFAKKLDQNLFILPSSIHEVILVPENNAPYVEDLKDMIRQANTTVVEEEEILSYQLYYCDRATGEIKIVIKNSEF